MSDLLSFCLVAFPAIFVIVDPLAVLPIYMAMTAGDSEAKRRSMALRASVVAFAILALFAVFGSLIFKVFGITLGAFKVAGGVLLLLTALDMLRAQSSRTRSSPDETEEGAAKEDVAIVPLAVPLLAGPGSIATSMVLVSRGDGWGYVMVVVVAIAATCFATWLMLRASERVTRILGRTGMAVIGRIMGLMLAAIAVQILSEGALEILPGLGQ